MSDLEVEVETSLEGDRTVFKFFLPDAYVTVSYKESGVESAERLVINLPELIKKSVTHLKDLTDSE